MWYLGALAGVGIPTEEAKPCGVATNFCGGLVGLSSAHNHVNACILQITDAVGPVKVLADRSPIECILSVSRAPGAVKVLSVSVNKCFLDVADAVGPVKIQAEAEGSEWEYLGFPCPLLRTYSYSIDSALVRTKMRDGKYRQRRLWTDGVRPASVTFHVSWTELRRVEAFIRAKGFTRFKMLLASEDSPTSTPTPHTVRIIGNPSYQATENGVDVDLDIEMET